jgi:hypothetical protein
LEDPEEIVLGRRDWALLAATGSSSTINGIAQKLKIFEFAAAKKVAELAQRGLVDFIQTEVSENSVAATELLSEVLEADAIEIVVPDEVTPEPEVHVEAASEDITFDDLPQPEADPADAEPVAASAPTWLPVESDVDEDPVPLLEELHRLHEAEATADHQAVAAAEDHPGAGEEAPEVSPPEQNEVDIDQADGGDLATRWKNLRKAKRGVHAANE